MNFGLVNGLCLKKAFPRYRREGRPISVPAFALGPGLDKWRTCGCLGSLLRASGSLPGGLERFFLLVLVRTTAASGTLGGREAGMESRPGLGELHQFIFSVSYHCFSNILLYQAWPWWPVFCC